MSESETSDALAGDHDAHAGDGHDSEGHGGNGKYWVVFFCLCGLTMCSFLTYFDWWHASVPQGVSRAFMMAVSCAKALLVMLFFMHLKWEASWKWVLTVPCVMMSIFLVCMLIPDIGLRTEVYSEARWLHAPAPVLQETSHESPDGLHADGPVESEH